VSKRTTIPQTPKKKLEQTWEDPKDPEKPKDRRDKEQLIRQKEEAERRRENLSDEPDKNENN